MDSGGEVTELDEDLCFLYVDIRNSLLKEQHFVKLNQSPFQIILIQTLFRIVKLLEYMFLFYL